MQRTLLLKLYHVLSAEKNPKEGYAHGSKTTLFATGNTKNTHFKKNSNYFRKKHSVSAEKGSLGSQNAFFQAI